MKLAIFSGSHRKNSQSAKVGEYIKNNAGKFTQVTHTELADKQLPFWDASENRGPYWNELVHEVEQADALVLITPEWNGMASPLLKNFLMMLPNKATAHKPVVFTSVSSGISGAYPIAELKLDGTKNNKLLPLPDYLIVRSVEDVLNEDEHSNHDHQIRGRIGYSLHTLHCYAQALTPMREQLLLNPFPNQENYSFGM
ncbi:NADPH-dependent oxidoreductase [Parashewanella curva]|uniref:NADPH-dependent oxidoreductase n=1 Tax=Parashewanella curva TaxID=2338552 RepID=A0A3L8Q3B5_9GAMM|nr:NAD(P)H-dependent oxidoreductase [Parashewanella curva]RLV61668.1 NADPH-dependent oxidoreductase [Parashewanella curva]